MMDKNPNKPDIDWQLTSYEGARREQLRRWAQLPLEEALEAVEEMQDLAEQLDVSPSPTGRHVRESRPTYDRSPAKHELTLEGCTPEPLMSYLKALGVLRLVSEQADPDATGHWRNDQFVFRSDFEEEGLIQFFLNDYRPTPVIGPWAGGSGFFGNDSRKTVRAILKKKSPRATAYKSVIERVLQILDEEGIKEKPGENLKQHLLRRYRREMPDEFVQWMDAAMVLQSDGQTFAPVLGTGGNDGRLDFTQNFMLRLVELKLFESKPSAKSTSLLEQSLFAQPTKGLGKAAVGQFSPGKAGGPNATQGMEGNPTDNPWDFILMLEGSLMLAGSVVRRLGMSSTDKATFPFTVRVRAVGDGSPTDEEVGGARGELWLPIWDHCVSRSELETLFGEGRVEVSGRPARDAVDFARAVAGLGVDRGIRSFARYGFLKRSGKAYLAVAMDRFRVPDRPREAMRLLDQLGHWLDRFRRASSAKETPGRLKTALRMIESAIFEYCRYGRREEMQAVLIALGSADRQLAVTSGQRGGKEVCPPLRGLSPQWLKATSDGSAEFDIALALAGVFDRENKIEPLRANLEPVTLQKRQWVWQAAAPHVVWNSADLPKNMAGVLTRRIMSGARAGCETLPLDFKRGLSLNTIASFIAGQCDDRRIEDLLRGLVLIDHWQKYPAGLSHATVEDAPPLPREYALLKLLFLPRPLVREWNKSLKRWNWRLARVAERSGKNAEMEEGIMMRPEPRILPLLRARRVEEACQIAYQRLHSSGLKPLPGPTSSCIRRMADWEPDPSLEPERLAAALLLPVGDHVINDLIYLVTRQDEPYEPEPLVTEGAVES